jgi:hypothetical protein
MFFSYDDKQNFTHVKITGFDAIASTILGHEYKICIFLSRCTIHTASTVTSKYSNSLLNSKQQHSMETQRTVKNILNGTWMAWNPVFGGKISQPRESLT